MLSVLSLTLIIVLHGSSIEWVRCECTAKQADAEVKRDRLNEALIRNRMLADETLVISGRLTHFIIITPFARASHTGIVDYMLYSLLRISTEWNPSPPK